MARRESVTPLKTLTPQKCQEYSTSLEKLVIALNRKDICDVKFSEIFIDINNKLYEIFTVGEYKEYPITMLMSHADESLAIIHKQLEGKEVLLLEILDYCISFKFLHYSMVNLFPNGKCTNNFQLDDRAAEKWWTDRFVDAIFVPVTKFCDELSQSFPVIENIDDFLKSVNFTKNKWFSEYVNKSNFNIFLRFYGGWNNFASDWYHIYKHPGHMVMSTSEHAEQELNKIKNELVKYRSCSKSYIFCLNWRCDEGLWNLLCIDDAGSINNTLIKSDLLLKELTKVSLYLYPKGMEPIKNNFRQDINLPSEPVNENRDLCTTDSVYCEADDTYSKPYADMSMIRAESVKHDQDLPESSDRKLATGLWITLQAAPVDHDSLL